MNNKQLIYNFSGYIKETDPLFLANYFSALLKKSNYSVINHVEHHFTPHGYTCLWLLAESHLAIHTFPEHQVSYFELSGCNELKDRLFREQLSSDISVIKSTYK